MLTIAQAAEVLRTTPRMLRYREALGLLPVRRERGAHRRYAEADLEAARLAARLEGTYAVSPASLAFAVRAVTDVRVRAEVERLAALTSRSPVAALDFDVQKARRLLAPAPALPTRAGGGAAVRVTSPAGQTAAAKPPA